MIRTLYSQMRQMRISGEDFLIVLVALAFVIPLLVIWALVAIPQELWPLKIIILIVALLAPAGFVRGYKGWGLLWGRGKRPA